MAIVPRSTFTSRSQERSFRRRKLRTIIAAREQVAVGVRRHLDRGMTEPRLHDLQRQFEPAVEASVDAPRGVEMAEAVEPGVFRAAVSIDNTGLDQRRKQAMPGHVVIALDMTLGVGEHETRIATRETVLPQRIDYHRR